MKSLIVIPARLESSRLPRKLLLRETGKTLLEHTYHSASKSKLADSVIVAADHSEISDCVTAFGGTVVMTNPDHTCGTDRVAEVAAKNADFEIVVNVQGDEPELPGAAIDLAISILADNPEVPMATLATPIRHRKQLQDPSCVKVVIGGAGQAIYFSRAPIPFAREWDDSLLTDDPPNFFQHVGLYAYRREFLAKISNLQRPPMESIESLEQLRVLNAGFAIHVGLIDDPIAGIDTPDDYEAFVRRQRNS